MRTDTARYWIRRLRLKKHPEGGWYRETYRSAESIPAGALPRRFKGKRSFSTAILFLLTGRDFSAFHRIRSDELWHFHAGSGVILHVLGRKPGYSRIRLGNRPERGESPQAVIPAGAWFAAEVEDPGGFALVGCTVAPGFDFADFEIANRRPLCERHPRQRRLIERLTRRPRNGVPRAEVSGVRRVET
jgi:hypothetical protein